MLEMRTSRAGLKTIILAVGINRLAEMAEELKRQNRELERHSQTLLNQIVRQAMEKGTCTIRPAKGTVRVRVQIRIRQKGAQARRSSA